MLKRLFLFFLHFYQKYISPLHPPSCRYIPSCSAYAVSSVERFGAIRGGILAFYRLLRCNPFSKGGTDFVPEHFTDAFFKRLRHLK